MQQKDNDIDAAMAPSGAAGQGVETSETEQAGVVESDPLALKEALDKEKERADKNLANWQRTQADLINYKKRVEQEKEELARFGNAAVIASFLPLLDDFERAQQSMPPSLLSVSWVEGVFLMHRKLLATLEAHGLSQIPALGQDFDPALHQAVLFGEGEEGKVVAELQKGYKLRDRVLRPAMVKVGQRQAKAEVKESEVPSAEGDSP